MRISRAASRLVAYNNGYIFEFSVCSILRWENEIYNKVNGGVNSLVICEDKYRGSVKYANRIGLTNPGYLHYVHRTAVNVKGPKADFRELACIMNSNSPVLSDTCHTLSINIL